MSQANEFERQMLALINQERTSRGIDPLQLEQRLNASSEAHSQWMLDANVFSHTGAGGSSAGDRMRAAGFEFSGSWASAENVAWQSERGAAGIADDVVNLHNALMNSPGHRANILNPDLEYIGIGIVEGNFNGWDAVMVTQNFAKTAAPVQLDVAPAPTPDPEPEQPRATMGSDLIALDAATVFNAMRGNDVVTGSDGNDELLGARGADTLNGGKGADVLKGGEHRDVLSGGYGKDILFGGNGADKLFGNQGYDKLYGGEGNDTLNGGAGNDTVKSGAGADLFVFSTGTDQVLDFDNAQGDRIHLGPATGIQDRADLLENHVRTFANGIGIEDDNGNMMVLQNVSLAELESATILF